MGDAELEQRSSPRLASSAIVRKQLYARTITLVTHLVTFGQQKEIRGLCSMKKSNISDLRSHPLRKGDAANLPARTVLILRSMALLHHGRCPLHRPLHVVLSP